MPIHILEYRPINQSGWDGIVDNEWKGTLLPAWGEWIPDEEQLCLFGDLSGKFFYEMTEQMRFWQMAYYWNQGDI